VEVLFAASRDATPINLKPETTIPHQILDPDIAEVFICGTHFDNLDSIVATCRSARIVTLVATAAELEQRKYGGACVYRLLERELPFEQHPWMRHIIRRSTPDATPADENFWRGMIFTGRGMTLHKQMRLIIEGRQDPATLAATGDTIGVHDSDLAKCVVASSARMMTVGGHLASVVSAAWSPVRPVIEEAAKYGDLAVLMRYNLATLTTHLSFFTYRAAVDLAFVTRPPFNGGGVLPLLSAKVNGIVNIVAGKTLEECVAIAHELNGPLPAEPSEIDEDASDASDEGADPSDLGRGIAPP
jgi:hypothetical protein